MPPVARKTRLLPAGLQGALQDAARCLKDGDLTGARHLYQSLSDQPSLTAHCLAQLGEIARLQGDGARAQALAHRALTLHAQEWGAYATLSRVLEAAGETPALLALEIDWGCALERAGAERQAAARFADVVRREPRHYLGWLNGGLVRVKIAQKDAAPEDWDAEIARCFAQAARLAARVYPEIARLLDAVGLPGDVGATIADLPPGPPLAVSSVEKALTSLGFAFNQGGRVREAIACYRLALHLAPGFALAHWDLALSLLCDDATWTEGWQEYAWRWHWPECPEPRRRLPAPVWRGEEIAGRRILIWTEQGFGDALQFVPLIRRVQARGATVLLETPAALRRLLAANFPDIPVVERPAHPDILSAPGPVDYVLPLMDLPARLALRPDERPFAVGYLQAPSADREAWERRLKSTAGPRVALVWAGNSHNLGFATARALLAVPGIAWHALQLGPEQGKLAEAALDGVLDLSADLHDFADTAAVLASMDLVISVDSAVAHLAGAMDRPVWVLVHSRPNWRWPGTGTQSPWYPAMRVFRRPEGADWSALLPDLHRALETWLRTGGDPAGPG